MGSSRVRLVLHVTTIACQCKLEAEVDSGTAEELAAWRTDGVDATLGRLELLANNGKAALPAHRRAVSCCDGLRVPYRELPLGYDPGGPG